MKLTILDSGSHANGYVLQNDTCALIIEAGVRWRDCVGALNYNNQKVAACIVTHCHNDHAEYISQYLNAAIDVYTSRGTLEAKEIAHNRAHAIKSMERFVVGEFTIIPFDVQHDAIEPLGFLISHKDMGVLLFATDTYYIKYRFEGLTQILLECNYADDILQNNIDAGKVPLSVHNRTLQSHMSLQQTKSTLQANDLKKVNNIVLIHISRQNGASERFKAEVERATGKRVTIAAKGVEIDLNRQLFQ